VISLSELPTGFWSCGVETLNQLVFDLPLWSGLLPSDGAMPAAHPCEDPSYRARSPDRNERWK
jgi:hypothetical protein